MRRKQVAIVGAGEISDYHLAGLRAAGAEVPMVVSSSVASAQNKAREFNVPTASASLEDIWQRNTIDAAVVATPDVTHAAIAIELINHGIPILVQKPLAINSLAGSRILEASKRSGVAVFTSFMHRYFEEVAAVRELVASGGLGEILQIRIRNATSGAEWASWFYEPGQAGGGALMQLGVHGIDLIRFVFGEIEAVSAISTRQIDKRVLNSGAVITPAFEDLVLANYRLSGGALVSHEVMYNEVAGTDRFCIEVYGTDGVAMVRTPRGRLAVFLRATKEWTTPPLASAELGVRHHEHFLAMIDGRAPDDDSGADGLIALTIAEQIYVAADHFVWRDLDVF